MHTNKDLYLDQTINEKHVRSPTEYLKRCYDYIQVVTFHSFYVVTNSRKFKTLYHTISRYLYSYLL